MANAATILMSITASGALTGALLWLTKSWISERLRNSIRHEYDQKLAAYQAQLKGEHDTQLERLRANLQIAATEHQVRYETLHQRVAETIAETYARLQHLYGTVQGYVSDVGHTTDPSDEEFRGMIAKAIGEFREYYRPRRIWLPITTADQVDEFDRRLASIARRHARVEQKLAKGTEDERWIERAQEIADLMATEIPEVFKGLETQFRRLLGSEAAS